MKKLFLFSTLMVLVFASQAFSLYNLMDSYATEVLLNKDGIIHNLGFIKAAENVSAKDTIALYRSHYDDRIGVTLEAVDHGDDLKGLTVRLQIPLVEEVMSIFYSAAEIKGVRIDDPGEGFLKSLGYKVDVVLMGDDEKPVDETRPGEDLPRDEEPKPVEGTTVEFAQVDTIIIDTPIIDAKSVWNQGIFLSKDDVTLTIFCYEDEDAIDLSLNIMNSQTIGDRVKEDIRQIANFYGFGESVLDQLEENASVRERITLVEVINIETEDFDFNSAMKMELDWLRDNGIVIGLTDQDVYDISVIAKPGIAGWNSRIVHSSGRWFPYYETDDPNLIFLEEGAGAKIDMNMPDGAATFPPTSVTPASKAITRWGKIKSEL